LKLVYSTRPAAPPLPGLLPLSIPRALLHRFNPPSHLPSLRPSLPSPRSAARSGFFLRLRVALAYFSLYAIAGRLRLAVFFAPFYVRLCDVSTIAPTRSGEEEEEGKGTLRGHGHLERCPSLISPQREIACQLGSRRLRKGIRFPDK
jgi:hypothetical protein